jgi:DNA modification methylase
LEEQPQQQQHHELIQIKIDDVRLDTENPNKMTQAQMAGLRQSMQRWGYLTPIIIDQNNLICDGEHRLLVYKELGYEEIPAYRLTLTDDNERRLIRQVMNKLKGEHDRQLDSNELATIFQRNSNQLAELSELIAQRKEDLELLILRYHPALDFVTPENQQEIDRLIDDELNRHVPNTKLGDIYQLGNHRLICADCSDGRSIARLFEGKQSDVTVTSPPYDNLREYGGEYILDFEPIANELFRITKQGGVVVWIVGDATVDGSETLTSFKQALHFRQLGFNIHDTMIYGKTGFAKPSSNRYHQTFEYMFVLSKGSPKTFNPLNDKINRQANIPKQGRWIRQENGQVKHSTTNITLQEFGMRFNVWFYDTGYMHSTTDKIAYEHPAIFPLDLAKDHIESWSNPTDLVYDPFLGSGSTLIACEQTNRVCYGMEIDPHYCDVIITRWEKYTGKKATKL